MSTAHAANAANPQAEVEQRQAARHLLQRPLTCAEHDPEMFRLVRRHEAVLDRWFTQRLGYRLHVDADTARLYKSTYVPADRPLRLDSARPLRPLEYTVLALVFAATASGPSIISLRDLVAEVRSAAAEADVHIPDDGIGRRAVVAALKWMIEQGLAAELHEHIDRYTTDEDADAVLAVRPDRIALLPLPALVGSSTAAEVLEKAERRDATRPWMRGRLVNDPVLYRDDLTDDEWSELRRRLGEERNILDEMFGLTVEARAEGVASIDPTGTLSDVRFPAGGTVGHAALLLIERIDELATDPGGWVSGVLVERAMAELAVPNKRRWAADLVDEPAKLAGKTVELLCELRLAQRADGEAGWRVRLLPAAARYTVDDGGQPGLW